MLVIFSFLFLLSSNLIQNIFFQKSFENTIRDDGESNSFDPDLAQHFVGPEQGPNCLQRLQPEDTNRQRVRRTIIRTKMF